MTVANLKSENLNPFDIAQHYFEQAADRLKLDEGMRAIPTKLVACDDLDPPGDVDYNDA